MSPRARKDSKELRDRWEIELFKLLAKEYPEHFKYSMGTTDGFVEDYKECFGVKFPGFIWILTYYNGKWVELQNTQMN